jgi:plastocyanin
MRRLAPWCAILLCLGACGDDEDDEPILSVSLNPNSTLRVAADEYSFTPGRVTVRGPGPLTIRLRNAGELAHNLRLTKTGEDVGGTPTFEGGETKSGRVNLTPGDYEMICTVGDHAELGMTGELEVR